MPYPQHAIEAWPQALAYLHVADSEIKTAVGLLLTSAETPLRPSEIAKQFSAAQGDQPAYDIPFGALLRVCRNNLSPGKVAELVVDGDGVKCWQPRSEHREINVAFGGLFASWGIEYPGISMQDVLAAVALKNGQSRACFEIHRQLAGYPPLPRAFGQSPKKLGSSVIQQLKASGVLTHQPQENVDIAVATHRPLRGSPGHIQHDVFIGLEPQSNAMTKGLDPLARIFFSTRSAEPIKDMLAGVEAIVMGSRTETDYYTDATQDVLSDCAKFKTLVQKGRDSSRLVQSHSKQV